MTLSKELIKIVDHEPNHYFYADRMCVFFNSHGYDHTRASTNYFAE